MNGSILEININAIIQNTTGIARLTSPETEIAAVIKADAYGLGAAGIAEALIEGGAGLLAVARCSEALELKRVIPGLKADILIMGLCGDDELADACRSEFIITLDSLEQAKTLSSLAESNSPSGRASIHIKLDTGFNRLGLKTADPGSFDEYRKICRLPGLEIEGVFSHLALDGEESDKIQYDRFRDFTDRAAAEGLPLGKKHLCDSIGLARYPQYRLDMVRAGAVLYGMRPFRAPLIDNIKLDFPLKWTCPVIKISRLKGGEGVSYDYSWKAPEKGAVVATLPVGYGDGYSRRLSNKGEVLLKGLRCPVVGLICMDQMMVDISHVPDPHSGDRITLLGADSHGSEITILEMARWAETNRNDILASIGRRVIRKYFKNDILEGELNYLDSPSYKRVMNE